MYLSDDGIVVVVSDGGVIIFCGGLGQFHRFGKRTQLMHAPRASSVMSLLAVVKKGLPIPVIIMKTLHLIQKRRLQKRSLIHVRDRVKSSHFFLDVMPFF